MLAGFHQKADAFQRWRAGDGRFVPHSLQLGLPDEGHLAGGADYGALVHRVESTANQLVADFGVNQAGGLYGGAAVARKVGDAGGGLQVQRVGMLQHARDHTADGGMVAGVFQP